MNFKTTRTDGIFDEEAIEILHMLYIGDSLLQGFSVNF